LNKSAVSATVFHVGCIPGADPFRMPAQVD